MLNAVAGPPPPQPEGDKNVVFNLREQNKMGRAVFQSDKKMKLNVKTIEEQLARTLGQTTRCFILETDDALGAKE